MVREKRGKSIFNTYLVYFISMALFCGLRIVSSLNVDLGMSEAVEDVVFTLIIQLGIMFIIPFSLYMLLNKVKPKNVFKTCNFFKINFVTILLSLGLGVIIFLLNVVVSSIFNGVISFMGYKSPLTFASGAEADYSTLNFFKQVLLVAVLPGFCEEFLHRGLLLQGTKHAGFERAIFISAICFGLIHFNIAQVAYAIVLGIVLGFASVVAKNIWVPIIMHFTNNTIAIYLEFASARGWFLGNYSDAFGFLQNLNFIVLVTVLFVALLIITAVLFLLIIQLYRQNIVRRVNRALDKVYGSTGSSTSSPILVDKNRIVQEMIETKTMINLNYEEMQSPLDMVMPKIKEKYKTTFKDNIFLVGNLTLGILVTLFTFIWGFL